MKNLKFGVLAILIVVLAGTNAFANDIGKKLGKMAFYAILLDTYDMDCSGRRPMDCLDHQKLTDKMTQKYLGINFGQWVKRLDKANGENSRAKINRFYNGQKRNFSDCNDLGFKKTMRQTKHEFFQLYSSMR